MMFKHPADRSGEQSRGRFERLAERASFLASSPVFFVGCFAVVLAWVLGLILGASDRFEAATAGAMSAILGPQCTRLVEIAMLRDALPIIEG
jgi:low affinity Fe/Cu permease